METSRTKERILDILQGHGPTSPRDLWIRTDCDMLAVSTAITELKASGQIEEIKVDGKTKLKVILDEKNI